MFTSKHKQNKNEQNNQRRTTHGKNGIHYLQNHPQNDV